MKYAAYLERYNFSFSDTGVSQLSLGFSNPALQLAAGSYVELNCLEYPMVCPVR